MKILFILVGFFVVTPFCFSQAPKLVEDTYPGPLSGVAGGGVYLNGRYIYEGNTPETGAELFVIEDGEIALLADINPGPEGSQLDNITEVNGKIIFTAREDPNTVKLFVTDGTAAGTKGIFTFDPAFNSSRPRGFIKSYSDEVYFSQRLTNYYTDGDTVITRAALQSYNTTSNYAGLNAGPYKEGIVANRSTSSHHYFYYINKQEETLLDSIPSDGTFDDIFSVMGFGEDFIFGVDSFDDEVEGAYRYRGAIGSIEKVDDRPYGRVATVTADACIATIGGDIHTLSTAGEVVYEDVSPIRFAGQRWNTVLDGDRIFFHQDSDQSFTEDIARYDASNNSHSVVAQTDDSFLSPLVLSGNTLIYAGGIDNGFDPTLHLYNYVDNTTKVLHRFDESSNDGSSVTPLFVQDGLLYFWSNLDPTVGRELYSIASDDLISSVPSTQPLALSISKLEQNLYTVSSKTSSRVSISVYDLSGRLLHQAKVKTNQPFAIEEPKGIFIIAVGVGDDMVSKKFTSY